VANENEAYSRPADVWHFTGSLIRIPAEENAVCARACVHVISVTGFDTGGLFIGQEWPHSSFLPRVCSCLPVTALFIITLCYIMGIQPFYGKRPHVLLWVHWGAACGRTMTSGIPNCLNCYVIFIVYLRRQPGRLQVGDPCVTWLSDGQLFWVLKDCDSYVGRLPYTFRNHSSVLGIPVHIHILVPFDFTRIEGFTRNSSVTRIVVGIVCVVRSSLNCVFDYKCWRFCCVPLFKMLCKIMGLQWSPYEEVSQMKTLWICYQQI
jgi:hypothetical protein